MTTPRRKQATLTWPIARAAVWQAARKLDPRNQVRNPVIFVTMVGAAVTSALFVQAVVGHG